MDRKSISLVAVGLLIGIFLAVVGFSWIARQPDSNDSGRTVLKLAHVLPPQAPVHQGMTFFADRVAELSGGQVEVQIFPNGQLGSETETLEQVQRGALALVKTSSAAMEGFVPEMAIFGVPYLFRDDDHFWTVLRGDIGKSLLDQGRTVNLFGLCYYDAGARSFYTIDRPINSPADLDGMKIRTMRSPTAIKMIETLGGSAAPIPFGELYTALQQGMVDGAENNPPSYFDTRHWEVARYYSIDEHTRVPDILVISYPIWNGLTPQEQAWITQAIEESVDYQRVVWAEYVQKVMAELEAEGVTVSYPDKSLFAAESGPIYEAFRGTDVGAMIEEIQQIP
jgi:tripartite ATP-independent transporter DctP family solute receptor